jgi:hypothetical protein
MYRNNCMSTVYMYSYPEDKYKWWCESTCHNEVQKFSGLGERLADSKKRLKERESLRKGVAKQIFWLSNQVQVGRTELDDTYQIVVPSL